MEKKSVKEALEMKQWLINIRRDFHKHPELNTKEFRTHDKIVEYLTELGIEYETNVADTGVG